MTTPPALLHRRSLFRSCFRLLSIAAFVVLVPRFLWAGPDIVSATIEPNGWVLDVTLNPAVASSTFNFGFTNQTVSGCSLTGEGIGNVVVQMTSVGFDDNATPTKVPRTVYGTRPLRCPYGVNGQGVSNYILEITNTATATTVRLALSDYVYSTDSNLVLNVAANWDSGNNAVTNLLITNNSTNIAGRVVGNWSRVPFQRITNNTATVACVAFGHGAGLGRPVRCVQFWAVDDQNNSSATNTVLNPIIDGSQSDPVPVVEYVGNIDVSSLSPSSLLTVHFAAYPWLGDTNSVLNTSDGRFNFPAMESTSTRMYLDRSNSYPAFVAVVSPNGADGHGGTVAQGAFDPSNPPTAFKTIGVAAQALAAASGGNNMGSTIYLQPGTYTLTGNKTVTVTRTSPKTWLTVTPFPGATRDSVIIGNNSSTSFLGQCLHLCNLSINYTNTSGPGVLIGGGTDYLWLDTCAINITNASRAIDNVTNWYVTGCGITNITQGLASAASLGSGFGTGNLRLIRGNTLNNYNGYYFPSTVLGNWRSTGTNSACRSLWQDIFVDDPPSYPIIAFNKLMANYAVGGLDLLSLNRPGSAMHTTNGLAVVQNIIEMASGSPQAVRIASIAYSSSSVADTNISDNAYCWNNTFVGQRINWLENSGGGSDAVSAQRNNASLLNNYFDQINSKDDLDYTPSAARIGNWPVMYGVGSAGNTDLDPKSMDGGWHWSFIGLNCYSNRIWLGTGPSAPWATFAQFVDRRSGALDGVDGAGNGDYHLQSSSPLLLVPTQWVLPYDLDGKPRTPNDPPGAYTKTIRNAAAAHVDSTIVNTDGSVTLCISATNVDSCIIEQSNDLANWQSNGLMSVTNGLGQWTEPPSTNSSQFFRLRL